jgi:ubiquinone/menaquinone biosynthesis C-methylase UbiE
MFYNQNVVDIRNTSITAPVKQSIDINNLFVRKIISFMRTGCKILDIGTGNGFILKQIYENSNIRSTLTGIDNSKEMVNEARQSLGNIATIFEGNNNNLPFADNTYDIVTAKNVTRYNSDELYRVLKKGGYFVFREYGESKGLVEIANLFKDRLIRSRDVSFYSTKLEKSGFEIVSIEQFEVLRKYQSVQEIINITKSFPFISDYSLNDEETIIRELNGNCEITSDPFILVAKKKER